MPNWDRDEEDFDVEPEDFRNTRASIFGGPGHRAANWNGRPIRSMDTDHIMNALLFCEKRFVEARANYRECFPSENPNEDAFYFTSVFDMFPDYRSLREEWDRRNR